MSEVLERPRAVDESSALGGLIAARVDEIRRQRAREANEKRIAEIEGSKDLAFLRVAAERAYRAFARAWARYQEQLAELETYERRRAAEDTG